MKNEKYVKDYFRSDNTVANWWNPTLGDYAHIFKKEELIVKNWFQGKNISSCLEVSCGKGRITKLLHNLCIDYLATDISPQMLSIAQKNVPNAHFRIEDAESLSFDCESKDAIICLEALVHYPNPEKALAEFYRVLKPEGILVLDSDNSNSLRRIVKKIYGRQELGEDVFQPYSRKAFLSMINNSGFSVEKLNYVGVISPIRIHKKNAPENYIIDEKLSIRLQNLRLDNIPILNRLSTYHLVLAKKR